MIKSLDKVLRLKLISQECLFPVLIAVILAMIYICETYSWPETMLPDNTRSYVELSKGTDMSAYIEHAGKIIALDLPKEAFYRAPLYSFFLVPIMLVSKKIVAIAIVQAFLLVATVYLTFQIGNFFFDKNAGLIAALILIFYGAYFYWIIIPHTAIVEAFLCALSIYSTLLFRYHFSKWRGFFASVSGALICLVRPNFLLITPLMLTAVFIEKYFQTRKWRDILPVFAVCALSGFLIFLPFLIWNNMYSEKLVFLSTNGASTWRVANSYDSVVDNFIYPQKPLMPISSEEFWTHQLKKTLAFCKNKEYPQNVSFYVFREMSKTLPFLPLGFGLIFSLFIASFVYYLPRLREFWPLYFVVITYSITIILFFIIGRFRITVVPAMAVMAGAFVKDIFINLKTGSILNFSAVTKIRTAIALTVFIVLYLFSEPHVEANLPMHWDNTAKLSFARGNITRYRFCVKKLSSLEENNERRKFELSLEYATASAFLSEWDDANRTFSELKRRYPNNDYLAKSIDEYEFYKFATQRQGITAFADYVWREKNLGNLGDFTKRYIAMKEYLKSLGINN